MASLNPSLGARPVYIWQDRSRKVHLLRCKNDKVCECRQEFDSILASDNAFLLLMITDDGTHVVSCSKVQELCNCHMFVYPNFYKINDSVHRVDCTGRNCSCKMNLPTSIFYIEESMPPKGTLWQEDDILHVANCRGKIPCMCTYTLFSCGYYKIRLSLHGPHLTKCALSVDYGTTRSESCDCNTVIQNQYSWAICGQDEDLTETDNLTTTFSRLFDES